MEAIPIPADPVSPEALIALGKRAEQSLEWLTHPTTEIPLPLFVEFTGCPKAGKTTMIGLVGHFFRRMGFEIISPPEGVSLWTPADLGEDLLASNIYTLSYTLQHILIDSHMRHPPHLVILDRGLFDVVAWLDMLQAERRITEEEFGLFAKFCTSDAWRRREQAVFLFTCDTDTSMKRELHEKLTSRQGRKMTPEFLQPLREAYLRSGESNSRLFPRLYHMDSSFVNAEPPSLQHAAYIVTNKILDIIDSLSRQYLLVTQPFSFHGFLRDREKVGELLSSVINAPKFLERHEAESRQDWQQLVPHAVLENEEGKFLWLRRRSDGSDPELRNRFTIMVGGHAEKKDWDNRDPSVAGDVFARCLKREIQEELVSVNLIEPELLGMIHDPRRKKGANHCAIIYRARVGGRVAVRRSAPDQEFTHEPLEWKTKEEIVNRVKELDPWSQMAAAELFGAKLPPETAEKMLFVQEPLIKD